MTSLLNTVINYVRRDGPQTAPISFLTIEDGGELRPESFEQYITTEKPIWEPTEAHPEVKVGKPGMLIAKIMSSISTGKIDGWRAYQDMIYICNECNIKFYPIGRQVQCKWYKEFTELLGIDSQKYLELCKQKRPQIIFDSCPYAFNRDQFHIILGSRDEWMDFLRQYVYRDHLQPVPGPLAKRGPTYELYENDDRELQFCYFNVFRWGITNAEILDFGIKIAEKIPHSIRDRIDRDCFQC